MKLRLIPTLVVAAGFALVATTPATAQTTASVVIHTTVTDAVQLECPGPNGTWEVEADVEVFNPTTTDEVATLTDFDVQYATPIDAEVYQPNVGVYQSGGFDSGFSLAAGETKTFHARIRAEIPCNATNAEFIAEMKVSGDRRNYAAGDFFLEDGTPVPSGAVGVLGVAGLGGVALLFAHRRRGTQLPEPDRAAIG
jgi:hypothetical protein